MYSDKETLDVIHGYREQLRTCETEDQVNKVYRHARIWSRVMFAWGGVFDEEEHNKVNSTFKKMRLNRLNKIREEK